MIEGLNLEGLAQDSPRSFCNPAGLEWTILAAKEKYPLMGIYQ